MNVASVTFTLLVKDEERRLPRALAGIPAGAPILIADCGSTDRTADIARTAGARVVPMRFDGFVNTRLAALRHVSTPWTFMLDADERIDDALRASLASIDPPQSCDGYTISRRTWLCGRPVTGCGWGDERLLRMFRTERATLHAHPASGGAAELHERWSVPGNVAALSGRLEHDSYPTLAQYFSRFGRYTTIESAGLHVNAASMARAVLKAPLRMLWLYGIRGGWRDGWRGAFVAVFSSLYPVAAHLKALVK